MFCFPLQLFRSCFRLEEPTSMIKETQALMHTQRPLPLEQKPTQVSTTRGPILKSNFSRKINRYSITPSAIESRRNTLKSKCKFFSILSNKRSSFIIEDPNITKKISNLIRKLQQQLDVSSNCSTLTEIQKCLKKDLFFALCKIDTLEDIDVLFMETSKIKSIFQEKSQSSFFSSMQSDISKIDSKHFSELSEESSFLLSIMKLMDEDHSIVLLSQITQACFKNYIAHLPIVKKIELQEKKPECFDRLGWEKLFV